MEERVKELEEEVRNMRVDIEILKDIIFEMQVKEEEKDKKPTYFG